ncbi:hypothetical protein [Thermosporothrix hazakensis]|uniref:hypothetical protein n=1 Tax=Thermosporothrix hazakensis TaxID=644383 RepID=UPI0010F743C1|nr:hypothetical protein [Thermosporothrix hazakensis]
MFIVLWLVLFKLAHLLVMVWRREPMVGWAIGPLGITFMIAQEPSPFSIWLRVLFPAFVSGSVLYIGLFTPLSPVDMPEHPLIQFVMILLGVLLTSTRDVINALRDLLYPLWGEARILQNLYQLRGSWTKFHFTSFGHSYLHDHFGSSPGDLLQVL